MWLIISVYEHIIHIYIYIYICAAHICVQQRMLYGNGPLETNLLYVDDDDEMNILGQIC